MVYHLVVTDDSREVWLCVPDVARHYLQINRQFLYETFGMSSFLAILFTKQREQLFVSKILSDAQLFSFRKMPHFVVEPTSPPTIAAIARVPTIGDSRLP